MKINALLLSIVLSLHIQASILSHVIPLLAPDELSSLEIIIASVGIALLILLLGFLVSITRKLYKARLTLSQHNATLESQVQERTAELSAANAALVAEITERKLAEAALRESDSRFRGLLQNVSSVSVQGYAMDGTTQYWNRASEYLYGYSAKEAIGRSLLELIIPPEMQDGVKGAIQLMTETGQPIPAAELSLMRKDGSRVSVYSSHAIVQPPGRAPELFCIDIDLTQRQLADEQLQILKYSIDNDPDSAYWTDIEGRFIYVNDSACKGLGYTREELLQNQVFNVIPTTTPESWDIFVRDLKSNRNFTSQSVYRRKDGSEFPVEINSSYLKFGEKEYIYGFARDISERRIAEEKILQSERKYRELFQVNKDGISIFLLLPDAQYSTFIEVNDAAPRMLGYAAEEMLALSPRELEVELTEKDLLYRQSQLKIHGIVEFETALRHKDGHIVNTEFTAQFIQYDGRPAIMNIVRDISERKQHERELNAIATVSSALRFAPTRSEMLPVIIEQMVHLLISDAVTIEIIDPQNGDSIVEAAYGLWNSLIGSTQKKGTGINAIISQTQRPYHTHDLQNDPNAIFYEWAGEGIRGCAGVPLVVQEKMIGFIWVGRKTDISDSEVRTLCAIADIAANAIHRTTMHEQSLKAAADLVSAYDTTLEGWANALELREHETAGHSQRVVKLTLDVAQSFRFGAEDLMHIQRGALLHDIGKMGIPDYILLKPGPLSDDEWQIMRQHPVYAYNLLSKIPYLLPALGIPFYHHERWDGSGYPLGLKGDAIPLSARVFAVVDVWDALTSARPYRPAWTKEAVIKYIESQAGKQFDPEIAGRFLRYINSSSSTD